MAKTRGLEVHFKNVLAFGALVGQCGGKDVVVVHYQPLFSSSRRPTSLQVASVSVEVPDREPTSSPLAEV